MDTHVNNQQERTLNRRRFLERSLSAAALAAVPGVGMSTTAAPAAAVTSTARDDNILVVVELSGGNDGLNTLVPFGDDAYYRARPTLGIAPDKLLKIDDHFGFNPGAQGLHRLWQTGDLAVVHGCGYDQPSYSHFTSMGYWHTAAPHSGQAYGWMGRLADALQPQATPNFLLNVGATQSLAVKARHHQPVVFDEPERFARDAFAHQRTAFAASLQDASAPQAGDNANPSRDFLRGVARSAQSSSEAIRAAWSSYRSTVDYGIAGLDLPKVAACIDAGLPAKLYYVTFRNNAFDTHVQQAALHRRLLSYAADAIHGFIRDLQQMGHGKRVSLLAFSEFGRRVGENANQGTDHGSANLMFVAGEGVRGGHYGTPPDLQNLNAEDNLLHTTDFRSVYGSVMDGWLGDGLSQQVLGDNFASLPLFESA